MTRQRLPWDADTGARLKAIRERVELTQKGLADKVGKSASYVSELERGDHPPSPECLEKLETALGLEDGLQDGLAMTEPATMGPRTTRAKREKVAVSEALTKRRENDEPEDEADAQARERRQKAYDKSRRDADHCVECGVRVANGSHMLPQPWHPAKPVPNDPRIHYHHRGLDDFPYVETLCCPCEPSCQVGKAWHKKQAKLA